MPNPLAPHNGNSTTENGAQVDNELNSLEKDPQARVLLPKEHLDQLDPRTLLVLFLNALSGKARIADPKVYQHLYDRFRGEVNWDDGGLKPSAYAFYACPQVHAAARDHREAVQNRKKQKTETP